MQARTTEIESVKPEFVPFQFQADVKTKEDACYLWHLLNEAENLVRERARRSPAVQSPMSCGHHVLWRAVDNELRKQGLRK